MTRREAPHGARRGCCSGCGGRGGRGLGGVRLAREGEIGAVALAAGSVAQRRVRRVGHLRRVLQPARAAAGHAVMISRCLAVTEADLPHHLTPPLTCSM